MKLKIVYWLVTIVIVLSFIVFFIPSDYIEISKIIVIAIVIISVSIPIYFFFGPAMNGLKLIKNGIPSSARIIEVSDTGVTINNNPQVKLILEIEKNLGEIYKTECHILVSRINPNVFTTGMTIPIKIDPNNEMNVALDITAISRLKN